MSPERSDRAAFQPRRFLAERLAADHATCRAMIRAGSRSFFAASLLLPPAVRRDARALYAFCRLSDDAVDDAHAEGDAVARLRDRLDRLYAGRPAHHPADRAFSEVVARTGLPQALPDALLDGLAWDAAGRRYDTLSDLTAYAARVAGTVGAMMTVLMGVRDPDTLARACDLGVAMQFTNIARDIGEDARMGRVYLPLAWLRQAGMDPDAFVAAPAASPAIRDLVARLLAEAEHLYDRAEGGVAGLPVACRPAIQAARILYREIGRSVAAHGHDSVSRRAVVPDRRKLSLVMAGLGAALVVRRGPPAPALPETRFLVEAACQSRGMVPPTLDARVGWVIDLFGQLEQRRGGGYGLPSRSNIASER